MAAWQNKKAWSLVVFLGSFGLLTPADAAQQKSKHKHKAVAPPVVTAPAAPKALPPLTLEQEPTAAPQVSYHNDQLTIVARNSTLADVLRAVHSQTGASVDVPSNATERVVGHFGPGPARDVLASLLNGSAYNYVLVGSASNPNLLDHAVLISQSRGGEAPIAAAEPGDQGPPPQPGPGQIDPEANDSLEGLADSGEDAQQPEIEQPQQAEGQPEGQPADQQGFQFNGQPPGVRSPQQMLQDLQRQQQLQQSGQPFTPVPVPGGAPNQPQPPQQ